jgi:oxygen-independent coproporphyrinogen-3 oxidase
VRTLDRKQQLANPWMLTDDAVRCDYVYTYPPRQAYAPLGADLEVRRVIELSVQRDPRLNLYLHFPFCRQICSFCNLYATPTSGTEIYQKYVELVQAEIAMRAPVLEGREIRSVYLGGGTPSLLSARLLDRVLSTLQQKLGFELGAVPEVAIEVSPDTASREYLTQLRSIGITRVNLGMQTSLANGLRSIGRRYEINTNEEAIEGALQAGFRNVCIDLIYGLPGQSEDDWSKTVHWAVCRRPETICAYPLTVRSGTRYGLARHETKAEDQYRRYDIADHMLRAAGYHRETHVRWVLPGRGGYKQKQYHWACENVIGFGAGARSYLWGADLRNGYSLRPRKAALRSYEHRVNSGEDPATDGFVMTDDERQRKAAVLGLIELDGRAYHAAHGTNLHDLFPDELALLEGMHLIERRDAASYRLTDKGVRHRDVIVQIFFSDRVARRVSEYQYGD